jgi:hypothetical protein
MPVEVIRALALVGELPELLEPLGEMTELMGIVRALR